MTGTLRVLLHDLAVYFYRALIHIMVSQWIPRGGRDVWGILKEVREFSTTTPSTKTSRGEKKQKWPDNKENLNKTNIFSPWLTSLMATWAQSKGFWETTRFSSLHHDSTGALTLSTSIKNCRQETSLSPCLSKLSDTIIRGVSANLPPSPICPLCQYKTNKTLIPALRTNAAWKDKSCLNSYEQNPTLTFISTF